MRWLAVLLLLSCSAPPEQCRDELWVTSEPPTHIQCSPGALLDVQVSAHTVLITCSCFKRGETRLAYAP